jgi:hypothetical protein
MKKEKVFIIIVCILIIGFLCGFFIKHIIDNNKKEEVKQVIDTGDVSNVSVIDKKLGSDIKITQGYLYKYMLKKSTVWYESSATVDVVSIKGATNIVFKEKGKSIKAYISNTNLNFKVGDKIYFVGTINIKDHSLELSEISRTEIDYDSSIKINFVDLINNIDSLYKTHFIVNGYLVTTEDNKYKLFDSKESYNKNNEAGNYFLVSFKDKFNYTGKARVSLDCLVEDTYKLKECVLKNRD